MKQSSSFVTRETTLGPVGRMMTDIGFWHEMTPKTKKTWSKHEGPETEKNKTS
jgi:hypothetical protein